MVFFVLVIAALVGAVWWWQRRPPSARHVRGRGEAASLLPYEDLPPIGAFDPVPEEAAFEDYVDAGLEQLTSYLAGRDLTA